MIIDGVVIADSNRALRVLETSHPPVFYIPPEDVKKEYLEEAEQTSFCEFKGRASYADAHVGDQVIPAVAWFYKEPLPGYEKLIGHYAFYPSKAEACYVGDELARPQEGDFYGGWITHEIKGPFKGSPGTWGW